MLYDQLTYARVTGSVFLRNEKGLLHTLSIGQISHNGYITIQDNNASAPTGSVGTMIYGPASCSVGMAPVSLVFDTSYYTGLQVCYGNGLEGFFTLTYR